ncbi:tubby-like F-box protein 3 isoform X2 [Daucus carota subsp. sativus]|uniref:tubby-like F-box protein 3 isoform X2 n=1 Tax=Daucus carota subsp. sativus TaxID=79200 RepID=UPI0007EF3D96|nr:PREDICTED: tubby-like F-box protein 3 isoform X2 [Daucus carota subsp. sativus]
MKLSYIGFRSKPRPESSCRWAIMPEDLLREVLMKVEASESEWPMRRSVVACAGVCRSWRNVLIKEIVRLPEVSGVLTFPISVKQPGPRDSFIRCFIKRSFRKGSGSGLAHSYNLYLSLSQALAENGKFLLGARKSRHATLTEYIISLNADDMSKRSCAYIGKLKSNYLMTKFSVYDALPFHTGAKMTRSRFTRLIGSKQVLPCVPSGSYPVAHISFETRRRMHCVMDTISPSAIKPGGVAPTQTEFRQSSIDTPPSLPNSTNDIFSGPLCSQRDGQLILKIKSPIWNEQLQSWCLNFNGRVTIASVVNFQLVASAEGGGITPEHEEVILQFGKVDKDVFTMDYRYPISAFQAFAICLSRFYPWCC